MADPDVAELQRWSEEVARDPASMSFLPLARAYRRQGRRDAALSLCLRGLAQHPTHVGAHALLAVLYLESGDRELACDEWSTVLRLDPHNFEAHRGLGFVALWYGAETADARGMVGVSWLLLGYLLHTTGELCLSPVGLSMVTKLSPAKIVSTVMGAWFLATAFSNYLSGLIAQLTGVHGEEGEAQVIPSPSQTLHLYGDVFGQIAIIATISALICFALSPWLRKWMHTDVAEN